MGLIFLFSNFCILSSDDTIAWFIIFSTTFSERHDKKISSRSNRAKKCSFLSLKFYFKCLFVRRNKRKLKLSNRNKEEVILQGVKNVLAEEGTTGIRLRCHSPIA